jgi:hypothetical protein
MVLEIGCARNEVERGLGSFRLAQDVKKWRAFVNMAVNFLDSAKGW